jgi:hypothetical protein
MAVRLRGQFANSADGLSAKDGQVVGLIFSEADGPTNTLNALLELPTKPEELKQTLNGRSGRLAWRWWLVGSETLARPQTSGDALLLFYAR